VLLADRVRQKKKPAMRTTPLILLFGLVAGCALPPARQAAVLNLEQAHSMAVTLANREASSQLGIQPFVQSAAPVFQNGQWTWSARRPYGTADLEAKVVFQGDGARPEVRVVLLQSTPDRLF
jgi:hypothetical protein